MVGHVHKESFQIMNSMTNPEKPLVVTSVAGSVTGMSHLNPAFRVYDFDAETMLPLNLYTYYISVDEANEKGAPEWRLLHDYLEEYQMDDLRPSNFKDLAERIRKDEDVATLFTKNESR